MVKESTCSVGDLGSIPGLGRCPGGGHGNPLQYSCLENPHVRGPWQAIVHGIAKSWTRLSTAQHCYIKISGSPPTKAEQNFMQIYLAYFISVSFCGTK